jgi:glycosyltransferase involved in cell wall biosynthesis
VRILLVSHPPLAAELGAAQLAVNLAAALAARGHSALAWSPEPLARPAWARWREQARAIEVFVDRHGPFDVVDLPAITVSPRLAAGARLVARSVQPELRYLGIHLRTELRRPHRLPWSAAWTARAAAAVLRGWRRAPVILCLGSLERQWMRRRFPWLAPRLADYVVAPSAGDRQAFAAVRASRPPRPPGAATRFLWIGRWAAHKGTRALLRFAGERARAGGGDSFTLAGCGDQAARDVPVELLRNGRVRIVPAFRRDELPGLLAEHDAGLFTSTVEGWGLCLNEMLEAGLTVYATPAGGVPDLAPFWGDRLRPFPPPVPGAGHAAGFGPGKPPDLAAYFDRFSWPAIAARYEATVAGREPAG